MRRERSQSSDRGRPYVPRWDNPTGQLPGTGIPSGSDSGFHGTSRRRDSSVPERSRLRTSESGASAGESRPSLFDGLSSGFSPFGAVRNMGASEGASGTSTGGVSSGDYAQTLTAMANAAIVSQLQERARASLVGSAVGAEVFHIGSPSDQQGSEFQSVRSRSTQQSLPTHPSTSPVSFGPIGSPSISGSAPPGGAMSSPGMMSDIGQSFCAGNPSSGGGSGGVQMPSMISGGVSGGVQMPPMSSGGDVGRVPSPPGLPLTDPPRVTGAYGIPAYDPVFGFASRGGAFDYQIPTPPPPPAANAGVKDPYVQLLESQSAMSMLMMQMAREMNQRSLQTPVPQQQQQQLPGGQDPNQAVGQQWGQHGVAKEMKMDEKWIPAMPVPAWKSWTSRGKELSGFKEWLEKFSGWLSLINDSYGPELWETIHADYPINPCRSPEQVMRSKRLFHILQQQFTGYSKIENLVRSQISATGITESNGFELLRLIRKEFSLMSRTEALSYREQCLKFRVKRNTEHLLDIIREVEAEIESFHAMLDASVIVHQLVDVRISEGDQFLLYLRNLPSKVQEFLQLHQNATTVLQLKLGVQDYYIRTRVQGDLGSVHVAQPVQKAGDLKDRTCFNCGKKGHLAENCPEPKKCSHCGKKGHVAKDCWEKYPDKKPKPKPKSQSSNPKGKGDKDKKFQSGGRGRGKGGKKAKGRGRGNKFRTVDGEEEEEQDEDYEGEDEPEGDDEEHPEPEGEDPSGSVNQINQMTMCVRGKCGKPAPKTASSSSTERVVSESHRVDEINLSEKFQSIGVGDPKRRWLVDSGATCHIISERWLSHYKVVYRYEVGIPVLKGAGDNVLPTRGMVDLECKVGKIKVIMRKVVICALDLNVLSSYSLHEQGWETRLGTLKVSGLYHKKVKFPLKISDRAWWLEVLVIPTIQVVNTLLLSYLSSVPTGRPSSKAWASTFPISRKSLNRPTGPPPLQPGLALPPGVSHRIHLLATLFDSSSLFSPPLESLSKGLGQAPPSQPPPALLPLHAGNSLLSCYALAVWPCIHQHFVNSSAPIRSSMNVISSSTTTSLRKSVLTRKLVHPTTDHNTRQLSRNMVSSLSSTYTIGVPRGP